KLVTGVQTCALPICAPRVKPCASFELTAANFERAPCLDLYAGRDAALSTAFPGHLGRRVDGGRKRTACRVRRGAAPAATSAPTRSEERRVGKEGRCR